MTTNNYIKLPKGFNDLCKQHADIMKAKGSQEGKELAEAQCPDLNETVVIAKLGMIMTEVSEAIEAVRKRHTGLEVSDTLEDELADTILRLMDFIGTYDIDIEKQLAWKSKHNASRAHKHGKAVL